MTPDISLIIEIMLFAEGFQTSKATLINLASRGRTKG